MQVFVDMRYPFTFPPRIGTISVIKVVAIKHFRNGGNK